MDLTHFSQDTFNLTDWVNCMFVNSEFKDNKEVKQYASSVVMRLQLAVQEVNGCIEDICSQITTTIPRVLRDVESLSQESCILRSQMNSVKQDIADVERNTAVSMESLVTLDRLKYNLTSSSRAFKEADNWTTLSTDIEEIMDGCDVDIISSKLVALQNCLLILTHSPDYEDKVSYLEGLKVRLEALLSPHLVSAFGRHDLDDSKRLAGMLSSLGRSRNLERYYYKCETQQLLQLWRSLIEEHLLSGSPIWLTLFYESLGTLLTKQVKWCEEVFRESDARFMLAELTDSVLNALEPSIAQVVGIAVKQQEDPLALLCAVKKAGENFLTDYEKIFHENKYLQVNERVVEAVYAPVKVQLSQYQEYEETLLLYHLVSSDLIQEDVSESISRLSNYCRKLVSQSELALDRCTQLSSGYIFPSLIQAISTYLENFGERLMHVTRHIEQQAILIQDDWTIFNACFSLIQTAGEYLMALDDLEQHLMTSLSNIKTSSKRESQRISDFTLRSHYILTESQMLSFDQLIQSSEDPDKGLLQQSRDEARTLNEKCVNVALDVIMAPITSHLSSVATLSTWKFQGGSSALSASFSPQEYITQIGQYLMTLPQHLEPLLINHSPSLNRSLREVEANARFQSEVDNKCDINAADFLISTVSHSTCQMYADNILRIEEVAPDMIVQLITDIDYICNIFEDLGVTSHSPLDKMNILLKAPPETYWTISKGLNPRLIAAVRQMRNIQPKI